MRVFKKCGIIYWGDKMRLFIAVNFNDEIINELLCAQSSLREVSCGGNFSRRENLHLTLAFIGETDRADDIKKIIDESVGAPFDLEISGGGRFGDLYWAGISKNPPLAALAHRLQNNLRDAGFDIEVREWRPHITLVRRFVPLNSLQYPRILVKPCRMKVCSVRLMKSEKVGGKLVYTAIYSKNMLDK